ncbi:sigma 54-interacting transcriptional regulator [Bacillus sp. AFS055030]|uniref:sigma-54 interaction domain-containing protein n=1 Tax=Bacillus sp. AFS055030 TaxID=2033507 RepID=UPI000BFBD691|nr:sigma 54-interacting transcriptional regulator [Bacillus sp. AFS055030]PGL69802.1 sigma-54-dependent Fis family transcriptional regulator [Bacillus sp. AFS055030]
MKHLLPSIEDLMKTNFTLHSNMENNNEAAYIFNQHHSDVWMLTKNEYLYFKDKNIEFYWKKAGIINEKVAIQDVIQEIQTSEVVVLTDEEGEIKGYITSCDLVSKVFESYQYIEAYFKSMIDTMDASVSIVDEAGKTVVWTQGAEKIFSIPKEEIIGNNMEDFFPKDMLLNKVTMATGQSFRHKQHKPREDLFVMINSSPIFINNRIVGAVAAETDITSQVMMNQELLNASSKIFHLQKEVSRLQLSPDSFQQIKGSSQLMKETVSLSRKMSETNANILLLGETGVGKEVFAKAIHFYRGSSSPFIAVNCGAITPSLFESEFFGYEKGAFSGADVKGKKGKLELAYGGTLFLDEIGDLPLDMQVKLLRVLQDKTFYRVGGTKQLTAQCRIIAATNKDLEAMVEANTFREDLYYRLNILSITIPPLRERKEDIMGLLHQFIYEFSLLYNRTIKIVDPEVTSTLLQYNWPGNVREMRNVIERLVLLSKQGTISSEALPPKLLKSTVLSPGYDDSLQDDLKDFERNKIIEVIQTVKGNKQAAAKKLGISRATLYNKMKKLNIEL